MYKLFFDGSKNCSSVGYGFVIIDDNEEIVLNGGSRIDCNCGKIDNNTMEFFALVMGLIAALRLGIEEIEVFGDSAYVIGRMNDLKYSLKSVNNRVCYIIAKQLESEFDWISYRWTPRSNNILADKASR